MHVSRLILRTVRVSSACADASSLYHLTVALYSMLSNTNGVRLLLCNTRRDPACAGVSSEVKPFGPGAGPGASRDVAVDVCGATALMAGGAMWLGSRSNALLAPTFSWLACDLDLRLRRSLSRRIGAVCDYIALGIKGSGHWSLV